MNFLLCLITDTNISSLKIIGNVAAAAAGLFRDHKHCFSLQKQEPWALKINELKIRILHSIPIGEIVKLKQC